MLVEEAAAAELSELVDRDRFCGRSESNFENCKGRLFVLSHLCSTEALQVGRRFQTAAVCVVWAA